MGRLIPAGTGMDRYHHIGIQVDAPADLLEGPVEETSSELGLPGTGEVPATPSEGLMAAPATSTES